MGNEGKNIYGTMYVLYSLIPHQPPVSYGPEEFRVSGLRQLQGAGFGVRLGLRIWCVAYEQRTSEWVCDRFDSFTVRSL